VTTDPLVVRLAGTALFEDAGRKHVASGVPQSGAFDPYAHAAATMLTGGGPEDATVEVSGTLGLLVQRTLTCAVTGPARVLIDGRPVPSWTALEVPPGAELDVVADGRGYLAVAGGFRPEPVLGSRSTCLLGPMGPPQIGVGDRLPLAPTCTGGLVGDLVDPATPARGGVIRVVPGPHLPLSGQRARVLESSRIGVRIRPDQSVDAWATLPSLGVLPGTIQVVPSGDWFILGPDAGTMGGYPVVGVVVTADLGLLAHMGPGDALDLVVIRAADAPVPVPPRLLRLGALPG
jgi:allophanate hydrolase subunit 2